MWMRGAFEAALPVQPVAIRYPHLFFNHLMALDSMHWHFFRVSCQLINFQSLEYLSVYVTCLHVVCTECACVLM
jgi:hypothetical protein